MPALRVLLEAQRERLRAMEHEKRQIIPWLFPTAKGERLHDIGSARAARSGYLTAWYTT